MATFAERLQVVRGNQAPPGSFSERLAKVRSGPPAPKSPGFLERTWQGEVVQPAQQAWAGVLEGGSGFYGTLANAADLAGVATGTESGGLFRGVSEDLARRAATYPEAERTTDKIYRGVGSAIPTIAKYALGSRMGGPVPGMAMTEAISAADRGPEEMVKGAATGAALGGALKVIQPATLPTRVGAGAALGGSQAAAAGGDVSDIVAGGVTFGGLLAGGGRGRSFADVRTDPLRPTYLKPFPPPPVDAGPVPKGPQPKVKTAGQLPRREPPSALPPPSKPTPPKEYTVAPDGTVELRSAKAPEPRGSFAERLEVVKSEPVAKPAPVEELPKPGGRPLELTPKGTIDVDLLNFRPGSPAYALVRSRTKLTPDTVQQSLLPEYSMKGDVPTQFYNPSTGAGVSIQGLRSDLMEAAVPGRQNIRFDFFDKSGRSADSPSALQRRILGTTEGSPKPVESAPPKPRTLPEKLEAEALTQRSKEGERGSLSPKPLPDTRTASEKHADTMIAEQDAARVALKGTVTERAKKLGGLAKKRLVDDQAPILDQARAAAETGQYELLESAKIDNAVDAVRRSRSMANLAMKDQGLVEVTKSFGKEGGGYGRATKDIKRFNQYLIAKQAKAQAARKEIPYNRARGSADTAIEAKDDALVAEMGPKYEARAKQVQEANRWLLNEMGVKSGLIEKKLAATLVTENPYYVPLQRIVEAVGGPAGGGKPVASQRGQSLVRTLRGSERATEDPLQSSMNAFERVFLEAHRNKAAGIVTGYGGYSPKASGLKQGQALPGWEGFVTEVRNYPGANFSPRQHIFWRDNGKTRVFKTTPEIAAAAQALDEIQLGVLQRVIMAPLRLKKTLTTGVNPDFAVANVVVDALTSSVQAKVPVHKQLAAFPRALGHATGITKGGRTAQEELVRQGGGFTYFDFVRDAPSRTYGDILATASPRQYAGHALRHPLRTTADLWRLAEDLSAKTEQAGRLRIYQSVLKNESGKGRTAADARSIAVRESNNALPNYMRRGDWGRALSGLFLYMNAGIQGNRSFLRAARDNPQQTATRVAVGIALPVALATVWNMSDEKRLAAYRDVREHELENNVVVIPSDPTKDDKGNWSVAKVKLVPGMGVSTAKITRELVEKLYADDPVAFGQIAEALVGYVSPIASGQEIGANLVPEAIKPEVQQLANYDFFKGTRKLPRSLESRVPSQQAQPWTSGTARKIAGALDTAPVRVEEYIKDRLGGAAPEILNIVDNALALVGAIPKDQVGGMSVSESIVKRFAKARGGQAGSDVYEQRRVARGEASDAIEKALSEPVSSELIRLRVGTGVGIGQPRKNEPEAMYIKRSSLRARIIDKAIGSVMKMPQYSSWDDERKKQAVEIVIKRISSQLDKSMPKLSTGLPGGLTPPPRPTATQ